MAIANLETRPLTEEGEFLQIKNIFIINFLIWV